MISFWCAHWRHTEPTEDGDAICLSCGSALSGMRLTRALLERTFELVFRHGRHSMRCVHVEGVDEWCCAPDCPSRR